MTTSFRNARLQVRAGTSIETLQKIVINDDANPFELNSDAFNGRGVVRVRDYTGVNKAAAQSSQYFDAYSDMFSIQVQGRFLIPATADDIVFGNAFDTPLRLPPGSSIALRFAKWFDPAIELDLYADKPKAFSPLVVTMNTLKVQVSPNTLPPWPSSSGERIDEDPSIFNIEAGQRRKVLCDSGKRKNFKIKPDMVFTMDFYNGYLNFDKCAIQIPGFEIQVLKYWDGQPLRYIAKMRDDSATFFIIEFTLVDEQTSERDSVNESKPMDSDID
ncbi:hypothetical protein BGW37DRAFT_448052 [Umbelopsis sp. PMI_123]|nr:hypothetical protein BGW37DRAFT_448052 [Umbelopsis sp. PMI_123]